MSLCLSVSNLRPLLATKRDVPFASARHSGVVSLTIIHSFRPLPARLIPFRHLSCLHPSITYDFPPFSLLTSLHS